MFESIMSYFSPTLLAQQQFDWSALYSRIDQCTTNFARGKDTAADIAYVADDLIKYDYNMLDDLFEFKSSLSAMYNEALIECRLSKILAEFHLLMQSGEWLVHNETENNVLN